MDLLRLEHQRRALEQSLSTLRANLQHWQTYEAELEGLKEELLSPADQLDIARISTTFNGTLVNEQEIRDLAALDAPSPRTPPHILGMLDRRQEYVQKNIETVQRQFWDVEAKLEELDFAAFSSANRENANGSGLPLTEIHEELDDDGNVTSSSLSRPEVSTTQIVDALRKAGVSETDLEKASKAESAIEDEKDDSPDASSSHMPRSAMVEKPMRITDSPVNGSDQDGPRPPARKKSVSFTADTKLASEPVRQDSEDGRKSVSFNDKIAVMPAAPPPDNRTVSFSPQVEEIPPEVAAASPKPATEPQQSGQDVLRGMMSKPGDKVTQIDDDEMPISTQVVIPDDETEEEARVRREMLEYHLHEVGHVVAQIDLEEEGDDDGYDDDDDIEGEESASASDFASERPEEDTPYTSGQSESEDESEDEFGRTKRRVIGDDYHKQMQELERRLIGNLGPRPQGEDINAVDPDLDPSEVRRLVIRDRQTSASTASSEGEKRANSKKRVSFAEALDVDESSTPPPSKAIKHDDGENVAPIAETVSERAMATPPSLPPGMASAKTSSFKEGRASNPLPKQDDSAPTGPPGMIIADTLLERPTARRHAAAPQEDDSDPIMQRRELAAEYYRRRNDMIRQQGGFKNAAEDDDMGQWMEEKDGKVKRVSRFKAARIQLE